VGLRVFVALELPFDLRAALTSACSAFRDLAPAWAGEKWVGEQSLHVTLSFLGDTPRETVPGVISAVSAACSSVPPFQLPIDAMRAVPSMRRAAMLWATGTDPGSCALLAERVDSALVPLGHDPAARPFTAHVTLVRARRPRAVPAATLTSAYLQFTAALGDRSPVVSVSAATVYSSRLGPSGPSYEPLATVPLGRP
jgi:2'-5' RNA ligase